MASTSRTQPQNLQFRIVDRLDKVPVVHDSVAYAHHLINSTHATATIYNIALGVANKSLQIASPVVSRTKPLMDSVDGLAVATVDRAEATFPYPFKTPTQDLIVVKQAKGIYDARLAPWVESAQPVLSDILNKTSQINAALGARASDAIQMSQDLSHALLDQLRQLAAHGKEIPGHLVEGIAQTTYDVKEIVLAKEGNIQDKSNKLGAYAIDNVKPLVDQIYDYVLGAKNKAQEEANKAAGRAQKAQNSARSSQK